MTEHDDVLEECDQLVRISTTPGGQTSVSFPFERPERDDILKAKILAVLARDQEFPRWWGPGRWKWTDVRRELGGRVKSEHFRRLVDELLEAGLVLEVYEAARGWGWREHRHLLVRADRWDEVEWGQVVEVRGQEDVLCGLRLPQPVTSCQ